MPESFEQLRDRQRAERRRNGRIVAWVMLALFVALMAYRIAGWW